MYQKYPRTYHLPFSEEIHSDDKTCNINDLIYLIENNIEVVITEKLDGGNSCLSEKGVFARSHSIETQHETFNYIKNVHYYPKLSCFKNLKVFGENLFAIHSIEYTNLKDYFYIFNILNTKNERYLSWDEVLSFSRNNNFLTVPVVYEGKITNIDWLKSFLKEELKKESFLGGKREGFVIRIRKSFHYLDFEKYVFKYVRKGHVQTDKHWSKNWKQQKLNN